MQTPLKTCSASTGASSFLPPAEHAENDPPLPLEQHTPPPHTNLPYADQYVTPAHAPRLPGAGASGQVPPLCFDNSPEAILDGQVDRLMPLFANAVAMGRQELRLGKALRIRFSLRCQLCSSRSNPIQLHHNIQPSLLGLAPRFTLVIHVPRPCPHRIFRACQWLILQ